MIPNGVASRARRWRRPPAPRFLVSGRIAPSKRLEVIVAAFARVAARHGGAELHLVGVAEPRHRAYAAQLEARCAGLPVRLRGAGFALDHLDEAFTAAVVLGVHQGCPNAVLEAMAAAIPVVANASGGTGELLEQGGCGWLLPEDCDDAMLEQAMLEVIDDAASARSRAERALARVRARHGLDMMAQRYLALLER